MTTRHALEHEVATRGPARRPEERSLAGCRTLVVGLGRFGGGVGVTRWLVGQGAQVTVTDQAAAETLQESIAAISDLPVRRRFGTHDARDLEHADLVVLNPAVVKSRSAMYQEMTRRGIPWTTELNLFCERCPAPVAGVTGSFGKSTTCTMLAEALRSCVRARATGFSDVHLGGNIGGSLLGTLDAIRATDVVVLEISNAQLEDLPHIGWAPRWSVITNLVPHHLDRHGTFEAYLDTKLNILRGDPAPEFLAVGELHPQAEAAVAAVARERGTRLVRVSAPAEAVELRVPGAHNRRNAACVLTVCRALGLPEPPVREALASFRGLEHRLEYVRTVAGVDYYNDSKSTAPSATVQAVEALDRAQVVIVGGQRKEVAFADCAATLARRARAVVCMGESGPYFASAVRLARDAAGRESVTGADGILEARDLASAVELARSAALPGDAVLFSPGAPSFDAYVNFTDRGRRFVELVRGL
ncbi:MAG: UDP-N-acetylmuramoyl-L-alanine--D-glutamate ligase [Planctomycetes bacterium]|nr:UDP-N-acetylmuramoyl-L-alanine--D-glutamate ligase [Planctomycetota bacterium]